ncbi:recombination protein rad52 [Diaporthe helianthi]|uniref:RAD52 homolog n=1 Tax=Diaporthe helianthi TaxID=158607 RepID=A0A2P5HW17_DIAHE|nr:recombination protein rad52 [Diaporthe helianthi]
MPAPGHQHIITANPFEDVKPRISEYTAQEIATLQSRLEKQLGPEYLSARSGPSGQKVHYIAAEKCIALANEVFGFNGWSSSIRHMETDFVDEDPKTNRVSLGLSVVVRVTLRDGTFHEDIGYGHIENCKGKAAAYEKAKKEGTTDALKRALRNFGNVLGNCIYDKDYLKKVTKMKLEPNKAWDESGLHRHADFAKKVEVKQEHSAQDIGSAAQSAMESFEDLLGEFDEVDFNMVDDDNPDEVSLPESARPTPQPSNKPSPQEMQPPSRPLARSQSAGNPPRPPQPPAQGQQNARPRVPNQPAQNAPRPQQQNQSRPQTIGSAQNSKSSNGGPPQAPAQAMGDTEAVGFFSARAVKQLAGQKDDEVKLPSTPSAGHAFNPHAETPSVFKTPGIDYTKSRPVKRESLVHCAPAETKLDEDSGIGDVDLGLTPSTPSANNGFGRAGPAQQPGQRANVVNPQLNQTRRIGAPMGPGSPLGNRGQYRPPTFKRPPPGEGNHGIAGGGGPRPALAEVTTNGTVAAAGGGPGGSVGGDPKRQRIG